MEILDNIAKQFLTDVNADGKVDVADAVSAIQSLLGDASGKLDFDGIITKLKDANLSETVTSWLGSGENSKLSVDSLSHLFDSEKLSKFAEALNIDLETAKNGLANAIPNLINQVSDGGQLLEKLNEGVETVKENVAEVADTATEAAGGLISKLKGILNSVR